MTSKMKGKYDLVRDNKGFLIASINDHTTQFTAKVLDTKLLRKMQLVQCNAGVVALVKLFVEGVQISWL